jgi:hypothetical protein
MLTAKVTGFSSAALKPNPQPNQIQIQPQPTNQPQLNQTNQPN